MSSFVCCLSANMGSASQQVSSENQKEGRRKKMLTEKMKLRLPANYLLPPPLILAVPYKVIQAMCVDFVIYNSRC